MVVVFVCCLNPEESAESIGRSMVATISGSVLCAEDATAINTKLGQLGDACDALRAMCRSW